MSTLLLGGTDTGAADSPASADNIILAKFTAVANGTMNQFRLKATTTGNVKVGIYSDSAGSPNALLNSNEAGTAVVAGFNTITFPDTTIASGTDYWLAVNSDANCVAYEASGGVNKYKALAYASAFPDPAGAGYSDDTLLVLLEGYHVPSTPGGKSYSFFM